VKRLAPQRHARGPRIGAAPLAAPPPPVPAPTPGASSEGRRYVLGSGRCLMGGRTQTRRARLWTAANAGARHQQDARYFCDARIT
jgi:hypothetical protein